MGRSREIVDKVLNKTIAQEEGFGTRGDRTSGIITAKTVTVGRNTIVTSVKAELLEGDE